MMDVFDRQTDPASFIDAGSDIGNCYRLVIVACEYQQGPRIGLFALLLS